MAVAYVKYLGDTSNKTAGTTLGQVLQGGGSAAGNLIVARVIFDNAATASKPIVSSISKMAGETNNWVFLGATRSTSTTAGAFASGEMWCIQTTVAWSGTITVTLDTSVTMKAVLMQEFSGVLAVARNTVGTNYSTTTTAASAATTGTAPVIGDLAIGLIFGSNVAAQMAGDNDTTAGSWSAVAGLGSTGAGAATNNFGVGQYKILTAATHQTYNNSAAMTAGNGSIVAILQAAPEPSITQAAYRFYDQGTESGSAALQPQDTAHTGNLTFGDGLGHLRIRLQSTTAIAVAGTDDFQLQWEKNSSGSWTNVGTGAVIGYNDPNLTDAAVTTSRLTGGTGSFVAGKVSEDGLADNVGWTANNYTELLFSVQFVKAQLANNDVIRFRVLRNGATAGMTYTQSPTVTLTKPPEGTATTAHAWAPSASGTAPAVPPTGGFAKYRTFNGGSDLIDWTLGNLAGVTSSPQTLVAVVRLVSEKSDGQAGVLMATPGYDPVDWYYLNNSDVHRLAFYDGSTNIVTTAPTFLVGNWCLMAVRSYPSAYAYFSKAVHDGTSWPTPTHTSAGITLAARTWPSSGVISMGADPYLNVDIVCIARFSTALSDAEIDNMVNGVAAIQATPTLTNLWMVGQTTPADLVGSSTLSATTGTTLSSGDSPFPSVPPPGEAAEVLQHVMDAGWYDPAADFIAFPEALTSGSEIAFLLWGQNIPTAPTNITTSAGHTLTLHTSSGSIAAGVYSYFYTAPNTSTASGVTIERNEHEQRWGMAAWEVLNGTLSEVNVDLIANSITPYSHTATVPMVNGGVILAMVMDDGGNIVHLTNPTEYYSTPDAFPRTPMSSGYDTVDPNESVTATGTTDPATWTKTFWVITYETTGAPGEPPNEGSATGGHDWAVTAAGKRTPKGTITTAHTWVPTASGVKPIVAAKQGFAVTAWSSAVTAAGKKTPKSTVTTTYVEAVTAAGKRTPQGTVTAAWTTTLSAVGKKTPKGDVTTAHSWIPAAVGVKPAVGVNQGNATTAWSAAVTAAGKKTPRSVVTTSYVETVTAAGRKNQNSTVTVPWYAALVSVGKRTPKSTGTVTALQALSSVGRRTPTAQATAVHAWTPSAIGVKPVVGVNQGTGLVGHTWAPAAVGKRTPKSTITVPALWTPVALGKKVQQGTATVSYVETVPAAPGKRTPKGAVTTTTLHTAGGTGKRSPKASATATDTWTPSAAGVRPIVGAKQGFAITSWVADTSGVGKRQPKSSTTIAHLWTPITAGKRIQSGTATTSYVETSTSAGKRLPKSTVVTSFTESLTAAGKKAPKGAGVPVVHTWSTLAFGFTPSVGQGVGLAFTTWAPAAAGKRAPKGSSTVAVSWAPAGSSIALKTGAATASHLWTPGVQGKKLPKGIVLVPYAERVSAAGRRVPKGRGDSDYWFSQVALGLEGIAGYVEGIWNGQEVVEMMYGDKAVIEWLLVPT